MIAAKATTSEMADATRHTMAAVRTRAARLGMNIARPPRPNAWEPRHDAEVLNLYNAGANPEAIMAKLEKIGSTRSYDAVIQRIMVLRAAGKIAKRPISREGRPPAVPTHQHQEHEKVMDAEALTTANALFLYQAGKVGIMFEDHPKAAPQRPFREPSRQDRQSYTGCTAAMCAGE